jgi:hypothetical protein
MYNNVKIMANESFSTKRKELFIATFFSKQE